MLSTDAVVVFDWTVTLVISQHYSLISCVLLAIAVVYVYISYTLYIIRYMSEHQPKQWYRII